MLTTLHSKLISIYKCTKSSPLIESHGQHTFKWLRHEANFERNELFVVELPYFAKASKG
jgi:hypothetical protein